MSQNQHVFLKYVKLNVNISCYTMKTHMDPHIMTVACFYCVCVSVQSLGVHLCRWYQLLPYGAVTGLSCTSHVKVSDIN